VKIQPVRAELCHAEGRKEGRTDITQSIVAFLNLANVPENYQQICNNILCKECK